MKPIPEIVNDYVLKTQGRMPETDQEVNDYLNLITHANEYATAFEHEQYMDKGFMKKFGIKTTDEIRKEGINIGNIPK